MAKAAFGEYSAFTTKNSVRYQKNNKLVKESSLPSVVVAHLNSQLNHTPKVTNITPKEVDNEEPITIEDFPPEFDDPTPPTEPTIPEDEEIPQPKFDPQSEFMDSVSIHTAPLDSIVQALHERFGIYTVYLRTLPEMDEINPLTGETFTRYHLGIAYQAAIRAKNTGLLDIPAEEGRRAIDEGRRAHAEFKVDEQPRTVAESRQQDSFAYRTSPQGNQRIARTEVIHETDDKGVIHAVQREIPAGELGTVNGAQAKYDKEQDEMILQPQMGKSVIRPNWK